MRSLIFIITFISLHANCENIILLQGEKHSYPRAKSVWVEDGTILKVEEGANSEILRALKPGSSEVRLDGKSLTVQVLRLEQQRTKLRLENALKNTLQLRLDVQNGIIYVRGKLLRWKDWQSLADSCAGISCQYKMAAQISDSIYDEAEAKINQILNDHALPKARIEKSEIPTIHISTKSTVEKSMRETLSAYGIQLETSSSAIELAPLVKVQITVAEIKKEFLLHYGVEWPTSYQAQILPSWGGFDSQFASAHFWEKNGAGRVLASPNILCRSGKDAEFEAGGEFPIKIINYRTQDVVWKKYGVLLKVSPLADYSGRMSIAIETEVSSLDTDRTVDGIPGLFTNRVQSYFDLTKPQTIALSGLIKSEDGKATEGWPGFSRIPILGSLFSSRSFRENKSELIIFVRPEIINPDVNIEPSAPKNLHHFPKLEDT